MRDGFVTRVRVLSLLLGIALIVIIGRLYLVQVVRGEEYSEKADRQYVQPQEGVFERGSIYFTDKNGQRVAAATLRSGFTLALSPSLVEDEEETYNAIHPIVEIDKELFMARAAKKDDPYEVVGHQLTQEQADAILGLELPGVQLHKEQWRYYPGDEIAAQTLGFVAFKEDDLSGRYGLERYYNNVLGRDKDSAFINFFAEVFSNVTDFLNDDTQNGEGDLVLTIEPSVQGALENALADIKEEWSSKDVGGVIINPKTGAVYALGVHPSFDLNDFSEVTDTGIFGNPVVESVFEMGSIIKPLTMAAGLDTGAVSRNTTYYDKGYTDLDGGNARISNYDGKGRGEVNMVRVLGESLNTGVAFVVSKMGNGVFADYLKEYGLGTETGIDLPGEVHGLLDNLDSPRDVEYATASFGQGIALTPIATTRALATLGNGGRLITPYVVDEIDYELRPPKDIFYDQGKQVIKPETSEEITRILVEVVDEYLLGGTVKLDNYTIAAKTGTAQISSPQGGYYDDRFFHSFFGYFPAYDPEFLIFLYTNEPVGARYASQTLTHPFMDLTKFLISYYEIPPDR